MQKKEVVTVNKKWSDRFFITFLILVLAVSLNLMAPGVAWAEPSETLEISGDGVMNPLALTRAQLQAMQQYQHVYSTINTWPTKKWYVGEGVKLRELLGLAGIKEDARMITFTSSDGYSVTFTVKELLIDKRYYFPYLKDNSATDGTIPGSPRGAQEVEPILALISTEGNQNPENMNDMDALLFICGQRAVTEQTNTLFLKYISKIEVLTDAPPKWDNPRASIGSGEVASGTLIELTNKRNDSDKVHYTTDGSTPTVNSPIFNWSAKRWWNQRPDNLSSINKPIELKRDTVIKAITIGPGREDSEVVTFSYQIGTMDNTSDIPGGPPTGVILDQSQVELKVGGTFELEAFVGPDNAADKRVTWSSSDTGVATVDNHGLVTVIGSGTAIITAKTVVGGFTATCTIKAGNESTPDQIDAPIGLNLEKEEPPKPVEPEDKMAAKEVPPPDSALTEGEQEIPPANQRYLAAKGEAEPDSAADAASQQPDGSLNGQILEVSVGTVPLLIEPYSMDIYAVIIFMILFFSGAARRYFEYKKEVIN
ncbi:MAG: FN3 associated domain-containing protein [Syntrophomonas sp.]|nr:FN3 associated domain-containing protein [Syntrophomonas sp.]